MNTVAAEKLPYVVHICIDTNVNADKAIGALPMVNGITYRKGYRGLILPEENGRKKPERGGHRILSASILEESRERVIVTTAWIAGRGSGAETGLLVFERTWWQWRLARTEVTTAM